MKFARNEPKIAPYAIGDQYFLQEPHCKLPPGTCVAIKSLTLTEDGWTVVVSGLIKKGQDEIEVILPRDYVGYLGDVLPANYRKSA